jgi:hypothetical protein
MLSKERDVQVCDATKVIIRELKLVTKVYCI